jgi:hypothetical protein
LSNGCSWSDSGTCLGTATPCSANATSATCSSSLSGCYWSSESTTCAGTPTPCNQLAAMSCARVPGCQFGTTW